MLPAGDADRAADPEPRAQDGGPAGKDREAWAGTVGDMAAPLSARTADKCQTIGEV